MPNRNFDALGVIAHNSLLKLIQDRSLATLAGVATAASMLALVVRLNADSSGFNYICVLASKHMVRDVFVPLGINIPNLDGVLNLLKSFYMIGIHPIIEH